MLIRLRDEYVVADDEVQLSVEVGEGQKAFIEVLLDGAPKGQGSTIGGLVVGKGAELAGRKLRVTATVTDTNPKTNRTCVIYSLAGGKRDRTWTSEHTVDSEGGTVDYDAIFRLL